MTITAAFVVFAVLWFLVMFITLQITAHTQGDAGDIVPGTPASAPANFRLKRTMILVTLITAALWLLIVGVIIYGGITLQDIDWFNTMQQP